MKVQIWMPCFHWGLVDGGLANDLQRAQMCFTDEDKIWTLRGLKHRYRWRAANFDAYAAQPASEDNFYEIININESRQSLSPSHIPEKWSRIIPPRLYLKWLATNPRPYNVTERQSAICPTIVDGGLSMKEKKITHEIRLMQVSNAMFLTVNSLGNDSTRIDLGFPPIDDLSLPFIGSLNAGAKFYTNSERTPFSFGDDVFEMLSDGHSQAIRVRVGWDTPFDQLFKDGGGPDVFMHHQIMLRKAVEKAYSDDPRKKEDATRIAEAWVGRLSRHVQLPWDALKYRAMFLGDEYKIISAREELAMKNISIANLDELNGKEGAALWQKKTEVLRFDSWLGYFWWEFLNDLRSQTSGTHCRRCGESIQNKSRLKKYCSKKDNPNCYKGYERDKKQKQRTALSFIKGQIQTRDCELRSETEIDASGILNG